MKLNVGCGPRPIEGEEWINHDKFQLPGVNITFDLDTPIMYPFPDGYFDEIRAEDVLEHVRDIVHVMKELGRMLRFGGKLWIRGPHAKYPEQVWKDPTHVRAFVPESFDYWDPKTYYGKTSGYYFPGSRFEVIDRREHNMGMEFTLIKI